MLKKKKSRRNQGPHQCPLASKLWWYLLQKKLTDDLKKPSVACAAKSTSRTTVHTSDVEKKLLAQPRCRDQFSPNTFFKLFLFSSSGCPSSSSQTPPNTVPNSVVSVCKTRWFRPAQIETYKVKCTGNWVQPYHLCCLSLVLKILLPERTPRTCASICFQDNSFVQPYLITAGDTVL